MEVYGKYRRIARYLKQWMPKCSRLKKRSQDHVFKCIRIGRKSVSLKEKSRTIVMKQLSCEKEKNHFLLQYSYIGKDKWKN